MTDADTEAKAEEGSGMGGEKENEVIGSEKKRGMEGWGVGGGGEEEERGGEGKEREEGGGGTDDASRSNAGLDSLPGSGGGASSSSVGTRGPPDDELRADAALALEELSRRTQRYTQDPSAVVGQIDMTKTLEGFDVEKLKAKEALYNRVVGDFPVSIGKALSKREREEIGESSKGTLVYGEISFDSFAIALDKIKRHFGLPGAFHTDEEGIMQRDGADTLYDLGSGTGKPVIAAAILHHFESVVGVEVLEGLYTASVAMQQAWEEGKACPRNELGREPPTEVKFLHGSMFDSEVCEWTDGDVVFANSTCFDHAMMSAIAVQAAAMRKGAFFITFTRKLPTDQFEVVDSEMYEMSWGGATVYIQQKTTDANYDGESSLLA